MVLEDASSSVRKKSDDIPRVSQLGLENYTLLPRSLSHKSPESSKTSVVKWPISSLFQFARKDACIIKVYSPPRWFITFMTQHFDQQSVKTH